MKQTLTLAIGLLALSACSASNPESPDAPSGSEPAVVSINTHGAAGMDASHEAMDVLTEPKFSDAIRPYSALGDAEASAQAALAAADGLSPEGASNLRQTVAGMMVQRYLGTDAPDVDAVGRYTSVMIAEDSPNAHLIADALVVLRPTWGEARVHAAAQKTEAVARAYLVDACPGCYASAHRGPVMGTVEASDPAESHRGIQDGITRLASL